MKITEKEFKEKNHDLDLFYFFSQKEKIFYGYDNSGEGYVEDFDLESDCVNWLLMKNFPYVGRTSAG